MAYSELIYEKNGAVSVVTLNRPQRLNALSMRLKAELLEVFYEMEEDEEVRAVVLTGGKNAFCAGTDIKERLTTNMDPPAFHHAQQQSRRMFRRIERFEKPVIAAVSGVAAGGGCELTLVCDLRLASETARFGLPEVKVGAIPGGGGTQRLPRLIGVAKAKELIFTGEMIDAQEALRIGMVSKVVPQDQLMAEALSLAEKLSAQPPLAIRFAKKAVNTGMELDLDSALDYEIACAAVVAGTEDRQEGFRAFAEKRKPVFKGR